MFSAILRSQWKWSRLIVVLATVSGFTLPVLSLQGAGAGPGVDTPQELLTTVQRWGVLYPVLAAALGLLLAAACWAPDHRGRHVHALTLPLPRWHYALLRYGAGLALLLPPILGVLAGVLLATATATIPSGLQGYPLALALRYALAVLVAFSVFFAISGGTARTAGFILGAIGAVIVVQIIASAASVDLDLLSRVQTVLLQWPGPLAIFSGRWMLIDV